MTNLQNELPQEILDQLDPKLAELFSAMLRTVSSRIAGLVRIALQLSIHPNRLVKYAFLYAEAERQAEAMQSQKTTPRDRDTSWLANFTAIGQGIQTVQRRVNDTAPAEERANN
jgi:hypothetical protein